MKKKVDWRFCKINLFIVVSFLGVALAVFATVFSSNKTFASSDATLSLVTTQQSFNKDDTFTLIARENPGANANVRAVDIFLQFDPAVLRLDSIVNGVAFNTEMANNIPPATTAGTATFGATRFGGSNLLANMDQDVATFHFTALAAGANSAINFTAGTAIWDSGVNVTAGNGLTGATITVVVPDVTAPVVSAFTMPLNPPSATIAISSFTATDNTAVTAWMVKETATNVAPTAPVSGSSGWQNTGITGTTSASITGNVSASTPGTRYFWAYVKDAAGNVSAVSTSQTVTVPDTIPPMISGGTPSGSLASGTTQTVVSVTTNENATCKYNATSGVAYASMANTFTATGTTSHSFTVTGLVDGTTYSYWIRCIDSLTNANATDYLVSFSVASPAVVNNDSSGGGHDDKKSSSHSDKKKDTPSRYVSNTPKKVKFGQTLTQRGKKFSKNSIVMLYFSKPGGGYYAPSKITTASNGSFLIKYVVKKPKGRYGWYALDSKTGRKSKTVYYTVR